MLMQVHTYQLTEFLAPDHRRPTLTYFLSNPLLRRSSTALSSIVALDMKKRKRVVGTEEDTSKEKKAREDSVVSVSISPYEAARKRRIEENRATMSKLGLIMPLAQTPLSSSSSSSSKKGNEKRRTQTIRANPPPPPLVRRSSRLKNANPLEEEKAKAGKSLAVVDEREVEELYTEKHIKLLGGCRETWTLRVDGCDKDGNRVYDRKNGISCHQCRQKTLRHHTRCSQCNRVSGQLCGDCLYMRYGENVLEVKENPNWICPVCRGICNCSVCRTKKGLSPTGSLYNKLGSEYKSVAHFLILSHQANAKGKNEEEHDAQENVVPILD